MLKQLLLLSGLMVLPVSTAYAGTYTFTVIEGLNSGGFNTVPGTSPFHGATATATFTYKGPLSFNNTAAQNAGPEGDLNSTFGFSPSNISNYSGSGKVTLSTGSNQGQSDDNESQKSGKATTVADFSTLGSFLASSGSASNFAYGSFYSIDLGVITAGTVLTILHDDGVSLYEGGSRIGSTVSSETAAVTDQVKVTTAGDVMLYYSRQNGTPSILQVNIPEPMSLALLGTGIAVLGLVRRRRG